MAGRRKKKEEIVESQRASSTMCPVDGCGELFTVDDLADVGVGDQVECPDCGTMLVLTQEAPFVLGVSDSNDVDDDDDDEDEDEDDDELDDDDDDDDDEFDDDDDDEDDE